jgi:hypothetical protein
MKLLSNDKIMQKLLKEWQSRLDLTDWVIKVKENVSPNDMQSQDSCGDCIGDTVHKTAIINIMDEKDYGKRVIPFDKEKTLVHELLHCKFAMIDDSGNDIVDRYIHQLIEDLAKALVKAKREGR